MLSVVNKSVAIRAAAVGVSVASVVLMFIRSRAKGKNPFSTAHNPPKLRKEPHMVPFGAVPGQNRGDNPMSPLLHIEDPYFWVRDDTRKNPEVLDHLRAENAYTKLKTQHLDSFCKTLYSEMLSHVQETDESCPYPHGPYQYYTRTEKGSSYRWHCRRHSAAGAGGEGKEEVLLDENAVAAGLAHCEVGRVAVSPDHKVLAYSVDTSGYETYTIKFKVIATGEELPDTVEGTGRSVVWGRDNTEIFYSTFDHAHRTNKVWLHRVGTPRESDQCLHTEDDELYSAYFFKSFSGRFLFLASASSETTEFHAIDLPNQPRDTGLMNSYCIQPRHKGVVYQVAHHGDRFFIVSNRNTAINFKLSWARVQPDKCGAADWEDVFPYDPAVKTDSVTCFEKYLVVSGREGGFTRVWVAPFTADGGVGDKHCISFPEPIYTIEEGVNKEFTSTSLRLSYSSLTCPVTWFDYDMGTRTLTQVKQKPCPNYNSDLYACERWEATSADGVKVPMSAVFRKDKRNQRQEAQAGPVHLYGYGSYEISIDPDFRHTILPLLDRGVTYVIAHIRGGGEMGRSWYEDAKYLSKKKTFEDFVACAQHLVSCGITTPQMMTTEGRSAGGLLMGAVLNMRPDLFVGAVAGVPFVDVMCTMSDASIPLTTGEWEEWGNPNETKYFQYMLEYSPYENVKAQAYPHILVTSGLFDPRVAYWEPTKWVAKLRDVKTDSNEVLLKMELDSGHFSASDRYHYLREKAFDTAFILDKLGLSGCSSGSSSSPKL
eukprot:CAMPEP_0175147498 /NCGR_PEP_ID=MMETSP0087-20121206/16029_1 /TAXON_ID=136419 /ORGANISM="Unknown Unknown, Strain D1" /LENGTH=766 /DNA_ID=CAMNT_0016432701 /DNA_START=52 /DNA_END=2352 /DNA_ORIENTATION=-